KNVLFSSEIGKRLYHRYPMVKSSETPTQASFKVTPTKVDQVRLSLHLPPDHPFLGVLRALIGWPLDRAFIEEITASYHLEARTDKILRILEDRWFNVFWTPDHMLPARHDPSSMEWRLYFQLVAELDRVARDNDAKLILFSNNELG